jgi:hypothetical protein
VKLILNRLHGDEERTTGILQAAGVIFTTIERPWLPHPDGPGGLQRKSCVPAGVYQVQPWHSQNFPETYILVNNALGVYLQPNLIPPGQKWGRSAILMHIANRVTEILGCIGVGKDYGEYADDKPTVVRRSTLAMHELNKILGRQNHTLEIIGP